MRAIKYLLSCVVMATTFFSTIASASLISRQGGMIYDTDQNITWLANANLFKTQFDINQNLVNEIIIANNGVIYNTPNVLDGNDGIYDLSALDFNTSNGTMNWFGAQAWVNSLSYGGYNDWRLPTTFQPDASCGSQTGDGSFGLGCTGSELGHLFYGELGGIAGQSIVNNHDADYDLFSNIQNYVYWSGSEYEGHSRPDVAWSFGFYNGYQDPNVKVNQFHVWAVRNGDVAAVPAPATVWLLGAGWLGLIGMAKRIRSKVNA